MINNSFFKKYLALTAFITALTAVGPAVSLEVSARVSKSEVQPGERFNFIVSLVSENSIDDPIISFPKDTAPFVLENSWTSSQMSHQFSYPGGAKKEIQNNFYYQFYSDKEGQWTMGPVKVEAGGKAYQTKEILVKVSSSAAPPPPNPPSSLFDLFENESFFPSPFRRRNLPPLSKDHLSLKIKIPSREVYLGEILPVSWNLYYKQGLSRSFVLEDIDVFQPDHFWIEKINESNSLNFTETEIIEGEPYLKAVLAEYVLFPLKTGRLKIKPLNAKLRGQGSFFFGTSSAGSVKLKSSAEQVRVLALPLQGRGEFTGAVGSFLIQSTLNAQEAGQDDILSYKIRFEGQGGIHTIELPKWPQESDFKVYDILESKHFSVEKSWKEYEILLSPKKTGRLQTPAFVWTTFDPSVKSYIRHEIESWNLKVSPHIKKDQEEKKFFKDQKKTPSHQAKQSLKPGGKAQKTITEQALDIYKKHRWTFWLSVYLLFAGGVVFSNRKFFFRRKKNWKQELKKVFQQAEKEQKNNNFKQTGVILLNSLNQALSEVSRVSGREIHEVLQQCPPRLKREMGDDILKLASLLEGLSFSAPDLQRGAGKNDKERGNDKVSRIVNQACTLIEKIYRHAEQKQDYK